VAFPPHVLNTIGLSDPTQIIAVGRDVDRRESRLTVDVISQKKGVFRSALSPHFKTGLISVPIKNEFGQIGTQFRDWTLMKRLAEREEVMYRASLEPETLDPSPGTLTREHLETLARTIAGDVFMVAKFSASDASELTSKGHDHYLQRYTPKAAGEVSA